MNGRNGANVQKNAEEAARPEPEPAPTLHRKTEERIVKMPWRKLKIATIMNVQV